MTHAPIFLRNICLSFPHKICFDSFTTHIYAGSRIGIIGSNGCGKSTLLKILYGSINPSGGVIDRPQDMIAGYVPQIVDDFLTLSGSQRLNKMMSQAISLKPNVLLLDEPTNHLDTQNRNSLFGLIDRFPGTVVIVSHDADLLNKCVDTLWHIEPPSVHIFSGTYDAYVLEKNAKRSRIEKEIAYLDHQKKEAHKALMKEQERAKKSNMRGQKSIQERKWPTVVSDEKARRAVETSGKKKKAITHQREELSAQLSALRVPEVIIPKFSLTPADVTEKTLVHITDGAVGYVPKTFVLENINFFLLSGERVAVTGPNACGKSTLIKGILGHESVITQGIWQIPKLGDMGYVDQHYSGIPFDKSPLEFMEMLAPHWNHSDIRCHLNDFLFRKNEEVNAPIQVLSGGEKARLCLAGIAAKTPKLLVLDEITNNLDMETKDHMVQVLKHYPGALLVVSHDQKFLEQIQISRFYEIPK